LIGFPVTLFVLVGFLLHLKEVVPRITPNVFWRTVPKVTTALIEMEFKLSQILSYAKSLRKIANKAT
jgi:hypothetical protein